jgi:hypothetical protein
MQFLPGDRVETPHGRGRVLLDVQDWSMGEVTMDWHHAAGGQPPRHITVELDGGGEVTVTPAEIRALAQAGMCDP